MEGFEWLAETEVPLQGEHVRQFVQMSFDVCLHSILPVASRISSSLIPGNLPCGLSIFSSNSTTLCDEQIALDASVEIGLRRKAIWVLSTLVEHRKKVSIFASFSFPFILPGCILFHSHYSLYIHPAGRAFHLSSNYPSSNLLEHHIS